MVRWQRVVGLVAVGGSLAAALGGCDPVPIEERLEVRVLGDQPTVIDVSCGADRCLSHGATLGIEYGETYDPDEYVEFEQYRVDFELDSGEDLPFFAARHSFELRPGEGTMRTFILAGPAQLEAVAPDAFDRPVTGRATIALAGYAYDNAQVFVYADVDIELRDVADPGGPDEPGAGADGGASR